MDFSAKSFKNLFSDVTTVFTRAKQYAEETIGTAERTELDQQYESLAERADTYKHWTERIVTKLEAVVQPNPHMRYGDMLIEKIGSTELKRGDRLRNLEYLGNDMIDAGIALGPSAVYGSTLVKVGKTQQLLGQTEKDFVQNSYQTFIIPFRKFLDDEMKTIAKERKVLEAKRLDLDAAKNRLRKAKSVDTQANPKIKPEMIEKEIEEAERDLKRAQDEFERQIEITKLLLEGLSSAQANHVRCLNDFVSAQIEYYNQCYRHMLNLQRELAYANHGSVYSNNVSSSAATATGSVSGNRINSPVINNTTPETITSGGGGGVTSPLRSQQSVSSITSQAITSTSTLPPPLTATINVASSSSSSMNNSNSSLNHHSTIATTTSPLSSAARITKSSINGSRIIDTTTTTPTDLLAAAAMAAAQQSPPPLGKRCARVLNDYHAQQPDELSLTSHEVIVVSHSTELDAEWMFGERMNSRTGEFQCGKVPVAYLEIIN